MNKVGDHLTSYWSIGKIPAGFLTSGNAFVHLGLLFGSGMKTGTGESRSLFKYGPPSWP